MNLVQHKLHVAVIGGGCAGLAAAARLAERGLAVSLYEASPQLGGRARGIHWQGHSLDNGQHILLGAYSETLRLLSLAGVDHNQALLRLPLQMDMPGQFRLYAPTWLPAPLHILYGLLLAQGLSLRERFAALSMMLHLRASGFTLAHDESVQALLTRLSQPPRVTQLLWEPLCLAALNTPLQTASAQVFMNVLRDSFANAKTDSDMLLPRCDLTALIAEPLAQYIKSKGGKIYADTPVKQLKASNDGFELILDNDISANFTHAVIAVSPFRVGALVDGLLPAMQTAKEQCEQYEYQPIYTIYLQYAEQVRLAAAMIGLTHGYGQWVFDRGQLCGQHGLLAVIISAEGSHQALTQENLALAVAKQLSQSFPNLPAPLWHKVIAEKRATFSCTVGMQRPAQQTALPGLYLAGDYTAGPYPATIEGAIRSGIQCAEAIISDVSA